MRQLKITKSITNRESLSLDKYLQEIGREDLITVEEEVELAQRIAAYIVDSGLSWPAARARAVEECGGPRSLPGNSLPASDEIETAVRAHYALFAPEAHAQTLLTKRKLALAVLEHLQGFDAYLTGAVLNGAATEDSPICLEVFTDDVKSLLAVLMDEGFDLEALDPQASAFGRADESIGFVLPWQGNMEAVRIDVLAPQLARSNPARGKKDDYQTEWEAEGRISSENLRKFLENRANS